MMKQRMNYVGRGVTAAALIAALALVGCSTTGGVETTGKMSLDGQGAGTLEKNVQFNSNGLKGDIQIVDVKSIMAGDMMKAQVTMLSKNKGTLTFQYRFDWYDVDGVEINSGGGSWNPLIMYGLETKTVQSVAPDPRAKEFKLKIRDSD